MSHRARRQNSNYKGYQPPAPEEGKKKTTSSRVKLSTPQRVLAALSFLILAALLVCALIRYDSLPDLVPTGYINGEVSEKSGRSIVLFLPLGGAIANFLLLLFNMYPKMWNLPLQIAEDKYETVVYGVIRTLVTLIMVEVAVVFAVMEVTALFSWPCPQWLLLSAVAAMFITLIGTVLVACHSGKQDITLDRIRRGRGGSGIGRRL